MAHALPLPIPCPVQLGSMKGDSLEAQLHEYVRQGNYVKVKKLLKKGVFVDAVNSMGQTSLFTAALLGLDKIVDVLLDYGSDTNQCYYYLATIAKIPQSRCYDGSTPVHAAAFSGKQWILSKLLDEGGDLRVHDKDGKNPQYWAMSAGKESSTQMLEFIQRCTFHMQAAVQKFPSDLLRKVGSSKALVCSPSRFGGLVQGNADSPLGRFLKHGANAAKNIYSFGFGKFYLAGNGHLGYLTSLPIIGEKDVVQADDEPAFSYHVGPYMIMSNLMWGGSRVTVKELSFEPHQSCSKLRLADLLIAEQEHSSKLRHPHLLQLMSVCLSSDLEKTRLVYERVNFGSLYSILHERRTEFPVLHIETILHVLLQISDALRFLHSRGFIHRSVTSYAIQIVSSGEAKLCNLEYMIESRDGGEHSDLTRIPVPVQLYKWCSPEVILEKVVTVKSDIYSFCTVLQEALTETPPWKGFEVSVIKQLIISGQQLEADVRLPMPYYGIIKSGLEPKQKNRSMKLQDIQYILKNDLKDLVKSQTGCADEVSKVQRPAVFADVNICLASAFSYQKSTQELQGKQITEADSSTAPRYSLFPEESIALVEQEESTNLQPVAQDKNCGVAPELHTALSVSDMDDSLCSFEINEIFASYPELHEDFLEEGVGLGQALKDEKRQRKEEYKATLRDLYASPQVRCEEEPVHEEGGFSESGTEYTTEEEERVSEASDVCMLAQVRGDAGRRMSSLSQNEQHTSKCVLNLKIVQSLLQQAADSMCRMEEKLDKLKATKKQKKLLQEIGMNQLSKQFFQDRHWKRPDDTSQNTNSPFSGVNIFLWKAIGPPSSDYIPPLITCQAQEALDGDHFQAVSKTAMDMEAIQNEKWKCFHENCRSENGNNDHNLAFSVEKSLNDQMSLDHEHLLPRVSVRCKKKFNLQCQRGGDSHSAASGSEEERWCYPKSRSEIYSTKISEERRMIQSEWRTEVKQMARRVASGQLELGCLYPASDYTSESEAEGIKEPFQHVTVRVQKSKDQQRYRWQTGDPGSEDRSESEESDLESAFRSSGGRSCQSPSQDEVEPGIAIHMNSVLPQQAENPSRVHSFIRCSLNSSPDVSEKFLTPDPDYFSPPTAQRSSELEVKITEKTEMKSVSRMLETSDAGDKLEDACERFLQKLLPEDAGSGAQVSGGKMLFCSTAVRNSGSNTLGVNQLSHMPVASVEAAPEVILWEPPEECKEKDESVTDIQDLSSIPYEQENYYRDVDCKTPRVSHVPTIVSTPLSSEEKIPIAFDKHKHCYEVASDSSFCGSEEISAVSRTFTTAYEEGRSIGIPSVASGVCSSKLNEPDGLPVVASSLRNTRKASAVSETPNQLIDDLPPPVQELLDEIEYLKQQDSIAQDFEEKGLYDCGVQTNVPERIKREDKESKTESERSAKRNHSLWTKESFNLAEETERVHSTLDDILEGMLCASPGDEEIQEPPQGHALGAASLQDPEDVGRTKAVEECGARARGRAPESCADTHPEDQKFHSQEEQSSSLPFRIIVLDQSSPT